MPIPNVLQPEMISINPHLRLRKFDHQYDFAHRWYQDLDTIKLVDGGDRAYDEATVKNMYEYLNQKGELYFIEVKEQGDFIPIGDVTFWQEDLPIVIGVPKYRQKGIGKAVIQALMNRAKELGFKELHVRVIYTFNIGSQRLFTSCGFQKNIATDKGYSYILKL